jgi:hypothetical protein
MKKRYQVNWNQSEDNITLIDGKYKLKASSFDVKPAGTWIGHTDNYSITLEDEVMGGIDFKIPDTFTIQDKTIYRFPHLNLPRQKVDLLKEKYNVKVIRDPNKADIHVISNKLFDNIIDFRWGTSSTFLHFFKVLKNLKENDYLSNEALTKVKDIMEMVGTDSMIKIESKYSYRHNSHTSLDPIGKFISIIDELWINEEINKTRDLIIEDKNIQDFLNIKNSTATVIYDTDVISIIDGQLAIIDNTEYEGIRKMIVSSDKDNRSLALEMLANCNLDKSYDVVSGIFYWEYNWLKDTNNWNSVNVKALRKRMEEYKGGVSTSGIYAYNKYIHNLIKNNKLTKFALDRTRQKLYNNVLSNLVGDSADVFNVTFDNLNLKPSLKEKLITNE